MGKIERKATGIETLHLAKCPCCGGEVAVGDCGYSSFNPGWAECGKCNRKWSFGIVDDQWAAGERWNELASTIRKKLALMAIIVVKTNAGSVGRNFDAEDREDEAKKLLKELEAYVIGASKQSR